MRMSEVTMKDNHQNLNRTDRDSWAKSFEDFVRDSAPYPISYDVDSTQPTNFSEFTYTEYLDGIYIRTQSTEINTRIHQEASEVYSDVCIRELLGNTDKYDSVAIDEGIPDNVLFFTGHNMFDMISREVLIRAAHDNESFAVKMHPLTSDEYVEKIARVVGWNRILPGALSAESILDQSLTTYVSSASELASKAVLKGNTLVNCSRVEAESIGVYYSINRVLFNTVKECQLQALTNMINCKWSGLIFEWMDDKEERVEAYYKKAIELKGKHKPMALPYTLNIKQAYQPEVE